MVHCLAPELTLGAELADLNLAQELPDLANLPGKTTKLWKTLLKNTKYTYDTNSLSRFDLSV